MINFRHFTHFFLILLTALASASQAGVIIQPTAASTDMGEGGSFPGYRLVDNLRDQSGLSPGYTSLISDFDSYIASNPSHFHNFGGNTWGSDTGVRSGVVDFDLGGSFVIESMALWNLFEDPSAIRQFNLLVDDNAAFSSAISLGGFTASNSIGTGLNTGAEVFTFAPTSAAFVRLEILNTHSDTSHGTSFSEVAFEEASIPVPATLALLGIGIVGIAYRRRKQIKAAA